jgi:glycerol-3-phosphate O-acyltransferase
LFVLPSLVAASLNNRAEIGLAELSAALGRLYPSFEAELFLRFDPDCLDAEISRVTAAMVCVGLLERNGEAIRRPSEGSAAEAQFRICAEIVQPFLEYYYLCMIYLLEHGSGVLDKPEVVERCADAAEQLAMLYTLSSPDLFEAALFENLIEALLSQGLVERDTEGRLCFGSSLGRVAEDLGLVLRPRVRQTLRNFAGAATTAPISAVGEDGTP